MSEKKIDNFDNQTEVFSNKELFQYAKDLLGDYYSESLMLGIIGLNTTREVAKLFNTLEEVLAVKNTDVERKLATEAWIKKNEFK